MYEIAKHEFLTWVDTLDKDKLSIYEITLLSILITSFDEIASVGTGAGSRAKLLGKKIGELNNSVIDKLPLYDIEDSSNRVIERLESLNVENFRGFGAEQSFVFDKQYTFFHGPNGSGKTSLCEALEYCLLGSIEEASARNIPLEKYIIHGKGKRATPPVLMCRLHSGEISECSSNYSGYRFAFIEKNRIEGFSHITASTSKTQTERIAALFGLSEFQDYVKGFSAAEVFGTDKYIKMSSLLQTEYAKGLQKLEENKKILEDKYKELEKEKSELENLIESLNVEEVQTIDDVEKYYNDPNTGRLVIASKEYNEKKCDVLRQDELDVLLSDVKNINGWYDEIILHTSEILSDINALNCVELYKAIGKLDETSYDRCPVCNTPLGKTANNPFEYARQELEKFEMIETAKSAININFKMILDNYERVYKNLNKLAELGIINELECMLIGKSDFRLEDVQSRNENSVALFHALKRAEGELEKMNRVTATEEYNKVSEQKNKALSEKLILEQNRYKTIIQKHVSFEKCKKNLEELGKLISEAEKKNAELKEQAEKEEKNVEFNRNMVEAYANILKSLSLYVSELPVSMAEDLSDKVKEYYNYINDGDADFELIRQLRLPISVDEKIMIEMDDGLNRDALHILSEGHVKILGLSILLAKALFEKSPFLVFDDIVNSIDDDHRNGVARLLISHEDFSNIQMILTCHGELFVSKLESYVKKSNTMSRYMFLPADTLEERGVFIKYQDSSLPLTTAREKYNQNQLKDCAAKCRQAVECIVGKLWRKVSKYTSSGISVSLRNLEGSPDLKCVTEALYSCTKPSKIQGAEELNSKLALLIDNSKWTLLNKGTHTDEEIPEFDRKEIGDLLKLVEEIANYVDDLKLKPINVSSQK